MPRLIYVNTLVLSLWAAALLTQAQSVYAEEAESKRPTVLSVIPAESMACLVVRDPKSFSQRVSDLRAASPQQGNYYELTKHWLMMPEGPDDHGEFALVFFPADGEHSMHQRLMLAIPVLDLERLTMFWNPKPQSGEQYEVLLAGQTSTLAMRDGYALISPDKDAVRSALQSDVVLTRRLSGESLQRLNRDDATFWVNMDAVRQAGVMAMFSQWLSAGWAADFKLLDAMENVQIGVRAGEAGLHVDAYWERAQANAATPSSNTTDPMLVGLPAEHLVLAAGMAPGDDNRIFDGWVSLVLSIAAGTNSIKAAKVDSTIRPFLRRASRQVERSAVSVNRLPDGADGLFAVTKVLRMRGDTSSFLAIIEDLIRVLQEGVFTEPQITAMLGRLTLKRNAEEWNGTPIHHLAVDFDGEEPAEYEKVKAVLGSEGLLIRILPLDDRRVITTIGGGRLWLDRAAELVRSGSAPLLDDAGLRAAAEHLSSDRAMELFVHPARVAQLINQAATATGSSYRTQAPPDSAQPVASIHRAAGPRAAEWQVFIPAALLGADSDKNGSHTPTP